jgi:CheY-like chemotaxis protein
MCAAHIVFAEDDDELRQVLSTWLRMRWDVTAVSNGEDALEAVRAKRPDLLVCDIVMPRMNGLEVVEAIRADEALADLPICMVTASTRDSDTGDSVWKMAANVDAFITKPFEPQELLAKVESLLQAAVKRRRAREAGK